MSITGVDEIRELESGYPMGFLLYGDITPDDVYALLDDALAQIRVAAEAIGITDRATFEQRVTSIAATGVF